MGNNGHAHQRFEHFVRIDALALAIHHLQRLVHALRAAHYYNATHDLTLELPSEAVFIEQLGRAAKALERAQVPPVTTGSITA